MYKAHVYYIIFSSIIHVARLTQTISVRTNAVKVKRPTLVEVTRANSINGHFLVK